MPRPLSRVAPDWWDYTTLDDELLEDAARLNADDLVALSREGFQVRMFDSLEEFFLAEAMEYIDSWRQTTADNPVGICGPIGPVEQLPLVAQLVNAMDLSLKDCHFWGMDEWIIDGEAVGPDHPLSFERTSRALCFDRVRPDLAMPEANIHVPGMDNAAYVASGDQARCALMQGGQGEVKHWAFNDPPKREGAYKDNPPTPEEYRQLGTRIVDLHPLTLVQNARTSASGNLSIVPYQAATVGPRETWKADCVSIWHPGWHDNPFGMRLSALMIAKRVPDASCPMSLLADHPNVRFSYFRGGLGECTYRP